MGCNMLWDHWSDLSVYVLKALVPFLIYVQGCFLLLSPNHVILSLFAVLLLDLSVWPPFLSTLFLCCFCFLCCIKHRHIYCHLNNYWVSLFFRFAFVWQNKPQLSVLRTCTLEHVFLQLFFFFACGYSLKLGKNYSAHCPAPCLCLTPFSSSPGVQFRKMLCHHP